MNILHLFGDTGGQGKAFFRGLEAVGVDLDAYSIPEHVRILHLGDLIHKGQESDLIVDTVDKLMKANPGRWIQLLGNHEAQHLPFGLQFQSCYCSQRTRGKIQSWYLRGLAKFAHSEALVPQRWTTGNRPQEQEGVATSMVFTHAGVSPAFLKLSGTSTREELVEFINAPENVRAVSKPGLLFGVRNTIAGPIWASSGQEVIEPWILRHKPAPFAQAFGHTALYRWGVGAWYPSVAKSVRDATKLQPETRSGVTFAGDTVFLTMDPDFGSALITDAQPSRMLLTV